MYRLRTMWLKLYSKLRKLLTAQMWNKKQCKHRLWKHANVPGKWLLYQQLIYILWIFGSGDYFYFRWKVGNVCYDIVNSDESNKQAILVVWKTIKKVLCYDLYNNSQRRQKSLKLQLNSSYDEFLKTSWKSEYTLVKRDT